MIRATFLLLAAFLLTGLSGCGKKEEPKPTTLEGSKSTGTLTPSGGGGEKAPTPPSPPPR